MAGGTAHPQERPAPSEAALTAFPARLAAARHRARNVLWIEGVWPVVLPVIGLLAAYMIAGLLRLPQRLPDIVHAVLLVALAGGSVGWVWWRGRQVPAPTVEGGDRRIEHASGLAHRPLQTLGDRPAEDNAGQQALWRLHVQRTGQGIGTLLTGWPRLSLTAHDPLRIGFVLAPVLLLALLWAGGDAPGRLASAFWPGLDDPGAPRPHIQAWITMPAYAPGAPVFLDDRAGQATVPQGAVLSISITDLRGRPDLRASATGGGAAVGPDRFRPLGSGSWSVDVPLLGSASLTLRGRGRSLSRWNVTVLPDAAPSVAWGAGAGGARGEWRTRLPYAARQAYGIASLRAELRLVHGGDGVPARVLNVPIPVDGHPKEVTGTATPDLSADPWAGEEVVGRLVATSASGRVGQSPEARFRLGARLFRSPVAKAVLDVRRRVAIGRESRFDGAADLTALGETPGPFQTNAGMVLNLASAAAQLDSHDMPDRDAVDGAVGQLWYLALDIEDNRQGDRAGAQASLDVRAAQEAVAAQLNHMRQLGDQGQSAGEQAELQRRMETLRQAIMRRMQALAQQALKAHTAIPNLPGLTQDGDRALSRMMQQMQDDARNGRSADAMQKLQQMEDMLERMRNATPQDMANLARQMQARQQAKEQGDALQDLIRRQSGLLDRTQSRLDRGRRQQEQQDAARRAVRGEGADGDLSTMPTAELLRQLGLNPPPDAADGSTAPAGQDTPPASAGQAEQGPPGPEDADGQHADRAVQHALGRALGELGQEFKGLTGKTPSGFADAEGAMKAARTALSDGHDGAAADAQRKALADLQKTGQQMRQSMKGSGGGAGSFFPGFATGSGSGGAGTPEDDAESEESGKGDQDPLGRKTGEGKDGLDADTHVPDTISRERAREIEQELRRRDSDRTRPREELDYLDRLLKPF
ncbi:DUF4175 domain-containing protein [Gluconacetobacter azotocaptans]|uniref:DUF4175 domain-containing protein n=1 Tax=Gluconacetobacter azotocaptans TaxID=142834 RepID=A0A7W4PFA1_9PROT|nr:DUF4175 domain-containing protein [Gluconacetobacter azotocaptans]MBB2191593.1 DUF4175 domain-containing protein [Gluconacetobacter azotocaptans]GBQ32911.1 hypothetical protein AA13594_2504 [Gluconacetobacter azotocaptans DSM 13594]